MSKLEKLLLKLVNISYASMLYNTLLAKAVVAALAKTIGEPKIYEEEIDNIDNAIKEFTNKLHKDLGDLQ